MAKRTKFKNTMFEQEDLDQLVAEHAGFDKQAEKIMATARGEVSGLRNKQKALRKSGTADLDIPAAIVRAAIKRQKLADQDRRNDESVPEDLAEVWMDAKGQLSFLAPAEVDDAADEEKPWPDDKPARSAADDAAEQTEGAAVLEGAVQH